MQRFTNATMLASLLLLAGCGDTLDFRNAEVSNGAIYAAGSNTPFSGNLTNIPYARLPVAPLGRVIKMTATAGGDQALSEAVLGNAVAAMLGSGNPFVCDVKVSDGALDGAAKCKINGSKSVVFDLAFKQNQIDGDVVMFHPDGKGAKRAEATFVDGKLHGALKIYSADGKIVVNSANFEHGLGEGTEEIRHPRSGSLIRQVNWSGGKQIGKEKSWSEDGTLLTDLEWNDGKQNGIQKQYDDTGKLMLADLTWKNGKATGMQVTGYHGPKSGYHVYHLKDGINHGEHRAYLEKRDASGIYLDKLETFVDGKVDGTVTYYKEDGSVSSTETYAHGNWVSNQGEQRQAAESGANDAPACLDKKIAAYRGEFGEDAMIKADVLSEWEADCKAKQ
ncbi:toxin-antitoxin system YwqK family antitoxin [Massilia sp. BSC265]|uniref:toxin-antitoxin system YwqK family antitoxin n=1 Tax=Massilia sp. BSC265 TaxID=1549812 RepID=UPI0004E8EBC8|nr:toxin-antitoxin system YwqK family antitoxin [Massilia sp. BSC265]KFI05460.1 hypothetical protein JN27_23825 [Massilia sp. BSC265]